MVSVTRDLAYSPLRKGLKKTHKARYGTKIRDTTKISYDINSNVKSSELAALFKNSGIRRPTNMGRIGKMITNSNLIISARENGKLVGILRALTDFSYACYVSDLAVDRKYQNKGIGKELVKLVRKALGENVMILLLSSKEADAFYPHVGFEKAENAWRLPRKK
ncbi:MAG: GNAT family N-acetyltransferase [Thaumarchaeota archaeon]|nr:GNAT family N-acetyltransferase [Nitrososphaerota archaeon]MDE1872428.1 GNAT family N-acetyltransferase [Nitrososphaerota archaeon]